MRSSLLCALSLAGLLLAAPLLAGEVEVEVTIQNVSPDGGVLLTPVWVGFHDASFDSYDGGVSADGFPGLEAIAEDGNSAPLSANFGATLPEGVQATIPGPDGPLFPGDAAVQRFVLDPSSPFHRYFSYVSMVIPSNDAFVANGNPRAHRIFDTNGEFTPLEFYIRGAAVNDAGTEVNDEIPANTAALAQAAPNTGVDEGGVVTDHPGFNPGGNVLTARPNGQFVTPGYVIAKVTVTAAPTSTIRFGLDGGQEVPAVGTDATGVCQLTLNEAETRMNVRCEHDVANVTAAHIHQGVAGENGPVLFNLGEPGSPIDVVWEDLTAADVAAFRAGELYVNVHSTANPGGEVRGQVAGCIEGPTSLCLNGGRFQVEATFDASQSAQSGDAAAVAETSDSGLFYFFREANRELFVKVLDACTQAQPRFWVFASGLTNVGVELTVTDTQSGEVKVYNNADGTPFEPILDTNAFATCP